jgi:hypothetical protein
MNDEQFTAFPKMARLQREVLISEKIDGTNAQVYITDDGKILKTMTWQPMETAPKDREFLGVWGSPMDVQDKSVDLFRYDQDAQQYVWSNYGGAVYVPGAELFAWMDIPRYNP